MRSVVGELFSNPIAMPSCVVFVLKTRFASFLMGLIRANFSGVKVTGGITFFFVYNIIYQLGKS